MSTRVLLVLVLTLGACQLEGPEAAAPGGAESPQPVLAAGPITQAEQAEAARLLEEAQGSFEARRFFEVRRTTAELMDRFPSSDVSGAALLLSARADVELDEPERADVAAERYITLLPAGDPRVTDARLLQVEAWEGSPALQLDRLLRIETSADAEQLAAAAETASVAAESLEPEELARVLGEAPAGAPLAPVPQVWHAVNLLDGGDEQAATREAQAALALEVREPERSVAQGVLRGELPPGRRVRAFELVTVLPEGGPPALAEFARLVREGIEVAAATVLGEEYTVTLTARDDEGDPVVAAGFVPELERDLVAGAVGFLEDATLDAAAQAREAGLPMVSPTARSAGSAGEGVYSLEGSDLQAASLMARYAASRAFQRVAIVMPQSATASEEADAFQVEAESLGIPIVGRYEYEPGATFFEAELLGARDALRASEVAALGLGPQDTLRLEMLEPVSIFLPIPAEDVEYVAAQIAHFALDTLAIEVIGTSGWTDARVLAAVEARYTDGVVATAPAGTGPGSEGRLTFQAAYEEYFQRSLVSPTPAIGYDAALLMLEALRPGRVDPVEVRRAFRALEGVQGATGVFSVIDDRIVRSTEVVAIRNRSLTPIPVD